MNDTTIIAEPLPLENQKVRFARKAVMHIACSVVIGVVAHYTTKAAIDAIDNFKSNKNVPNQ
jgi:hypothetical protein